MDVDNEDEVTDEAKPEEKKEKPQNDIEDIKNDKTETNNSDENKKTVENVDSTVDKDLISDKAMEIDDCEMTDAKDAKTEKDTEKIENENKAEIETIKDNGSVEDTKSDKEENDIAKKESEEKPKVVLENGKDDAAKVSNEPVGKDTEQNNDKKEKSDSVADKKENSTSVSVDEIPAEKEVCKTTGKDSVDVEDSINGKAEEPAAEVLDAKSDIKEDLPDKNEQVLENTINKIESKVDVAKIENTSDSAEKNSTEITEVSSCDVEKPIEKTTENKDEEMEELKEESKPSVITTEVAETVAAAVVSNADEEKMEIDGKSSTETNGSLSIVNGSKKENEIDKGENEMETNAPTETDPLPESSSNKKTNESESTKNEIEMGNGPTDKTQDTEKTKSTNDSTSIPVPIIRCSSSLDSNTTDSKTIQKTEISQIIEKTSPDSKEKKSRVEITIEETDSQSGQITQTTTHIVKEISITEQTHGSPSKIEAMADELKEVVAEISEAVKNGTDDESAAAKKIHDPSPSKNNAEKDSAIEQKNATNSDECKNGKAGDAAESAAIVSDVQTNGNTNEECSHKNGNDSDKENEETLTEKPTEISANGEAEKDSSVCDKGLVVKKCPDLLVKSPAPAVTAAAAATETES